MAPSGFELKPLRIAVYESLPGEREQFADRLEMGRFLNQRTPEQFKVKNIRAERELTRDESYVSDFTNVPITIEDIEVTLSDSDRGILDRMKASGTMGRTDGEVLRFVFHSWWIGNFMSGPGRF